MAPGDWESQADNWLRWARKPGHDAYWYYRDAFFDHIVPPAGRSTLEVGCGEGRVARDLSARGHRVVGLDLAPTLLAAAKCADPGGAYLIGEASGLPFPDATFDQVVAYNSLMDIDNMSGAVGEVGRVLSPGGAFSICVTHPVSDVGRFIDPSTFVIERSYLETHRFEETFERDGLTITFLGWTHPLSAYAGALEAAGFHITRLREPSLERPGHFYERWRTVPMFLHLRAVKERQPVRLVPQPVESNESQMRSESPSMTPMPPDDDGAPQHNTAIT